MQIDSEHKNGNRTHMRIRHGLDFSREARQRKRRSTFTRGLISTTAIKVHKTIKLL